MRDFVFGLNYLYMIAKKIREYEKNCIQKKTMDLVNTSACRQVKRGHVFIQRLQIKNAFVRF